MKNGFNRFLFYLDQIKTLLNKAGKEKDPALWLFRNNARTPFFMLESLARMYSAIHNPQKFGKLKEQFKQIEDGLGQIDYYQWLTTAIASESKIPAASRQFIKIQTDKSSANLNEILEDKNWLSDDNKRIKKITKKLEGSNWLNASKEVQAISVFYNKSAGSIIRFVSLSNFHFRNIEKDVHELRRRLRWLSIYPQALQGVVQFAPDIKTAAYLEKYLTQEIVNSPYNKLPEAGNNSAFLLLNKNYFLALSWMIAQLGNLKDEGLLVTGLGESIKESTGCSKEQAVKKAYTILGNKQRTIEAILDEADSITRIYFKENNLQHLIAGTTDFRQ